jgi:replicative DNA helicase
MTPPPVTNGHQTAPPQPTAVPGAVPPHSIEAEQAVLGAILQSDRTHYAYIIEDGLRAEDFYRERHRTIFESVVALFTASEPIDVLTVTEHLRSRGKLEDAGGQAEIDSLTAAAPSVGALRHYGRLVKERALLRRLLTATYEIQSSVHGHDGAPRDIIEQAERTILEVAHDDRQKDFVKVGDVLHLEIGKWQKLSTEGQTLTGTSTRSPAGSSRAT